MPSPCRVCYLSIASIVLGASSLTSNAMAQITDDGTLSTNVASPNGLNFTITGGDRTGNNLFHSFDQFSVPTNGSAVFDQAADVETIFSRVTGSASTIDGVMQANGTANLFLLNPQGIVFGPNAALSIGGSFLATTADRVLFENNQFFSATDTTTAPLLTLSTPTGLQFGSLQNNITVQGDGHNLDLNLDIFPPVRELIRTNRSVGLRVNANETLALIGGDILLEGGNLTANQGRIELGSVAQPGNVFLNPTANGFIARYGEINSFGNLSLTQASSVEVSGPGSGYLHVQAGNISVVDESALISNTLGADGGGNVLIRAAESVDIIGTETGGFPSAFFNDTEFGATGNAGNFRLETGDLRIANNGFISSSTAGAGAGGDLTIVADTVDVVFEPEFYPDYPTGILAQTIIGSTGQGGNLTIDAQDDVSLRDGVFILTAAYGTGNAGDLKISADTLDVVGTTADGRFGSFVSADTHFSGRGGDLEINANSLNIKNGGQIVTRTFFSTGNGGNLTVNSDSIEISGAQTNGAFTSGLFADTYSSGNAGNLVVNTNSLNVKNGGRLAASGFSDGDGGNLVINASDTVNVIGVFEGRYVFSSGLFVDTYASGQGGNLEINANTLSVGDGAQLAAGSIGDGDGGTFKINADTIDVAGTNITGTLETASGLFVDAFWTGDAGDLEINANELSVRDGAQLAAGTRGDGNGGDITLAISYVTVTEGGSISAATFSSGNGGNISVQANVVEVNDVEINSTGVLSGIVTFVAPESLDLLGSPLSAATGNGGDITLKANQLLLNRGGQIDASTFGEGQAGNLDLTAETIELSGISDILDDGTRIPSRIISLSETDAAAGTITLNGDTLIVREGAEVNVSNRSQGDAGNLNLAFDRVRLDTGGRLLAEVNGGEQGNINLVANELLLLRRGSSITTNATAGLSTGGNITVDAPFIVGVANENSDIVANAVQGNGGNISIQTQGLLGLEFRTGPTPQSDITVSSDLGIDGTVTIVRPSVDITVDDLELAENFQDASNQIATSCSPGNNTLLLTGRGGMPPSATNLQTHSPWIDRRLLPTDIILPSPDAGARASQPATPATIEEATGIDITPDGTVQLTATVSPQLPAAPCTAQRRQTLEGEG